MIRRLGISPVEYRKLDPWDVWDVIRAFGNPKTEEEAKARKHFEESQKQLDELGFADRVESVDPRNP